MSGLEFSGAGMLWAFLLAAAVSAGAWRLRMLNGSGALAAALLGGLVFGVGGWPWAILLLTFFGSSSLLSRAFCGHKREVAAGFAKGGRRDWAQVAANGGLGALLILAAAFGWLDHEIAWLAYAGALSAVTADTWATELGVLSRQQPRLITSWKRVAPGSSGGISLLGITASLLGGALIAGLAVLLGNPGGVLVFVAIAVAGLTGSLIDSLLGATIQTMYYCPSCQKETERHPTHSCGTATALKRGWPWLDNDWVNFFSSALSAGLAVGLYLTL